MLLTNISYELFMAISISDLEQSLNPQNKRF